LFYLSLIFTSKAGTYPGKSAKGGLIAFPINIQLGWERLTRKNALAYYTTKSITAFEKSNNKKIQGPYSKHYIFFITRESAQ
jgi:hypothetical protein